MGTFILSLNINNHYGTFASVDLIVSIPDWDELSAEKRALKLLEEIRKEKERIKNKLKGGEQSADSVIASVSNLIQISGAGSVSYEWTDMKG